MCECNGEFVGGVINELFFYCIFILYIAGVEKGTQWVGIGGGDFDF